MIGVGAALIVSLSGVRSETLRVARDLAAELRHRDVPLSLLVAPRGPGGHRLAADTETHGWLREERSAGAAVVLHGYDQAATSSRRAEFSTLRQHEASLRLTAADRVLESLGLRTRLFAPPRWVMSSGARKALPRLGFDLCADLTTVHDLRAGTVVRSRVLGVTGRAGGSGLGATVNPRTEPWWCRALVLQSVRTARRGGLVRISVDARHLDRPGPRHAILDAVDLALHHDATPRSYSRDTIAIRRAA